MRLLVEVMATSTAHKPSILQTDDTFIAEVPWGPNRCVLVFRRTHGGRTYVRLRTWNRHRERRFWYPTDRFFVIPVDNAEVLAAALRAAVHGEPQSEVPAWYAAREQADRERYERLLELEAPEQVLERCRRRLTRRRRQ